MKTAPQSCVFCIILSWILSYGVYGAKTFNDSFAAADADTRRDEPYSCRGVQLLLDEYLLEKSENVIRQVNQPKREPNLANPLITGGEDHCFQPYFTILQDPQTRRFRIWYGCWGDDQRTDRSHIGYMESLDGIHWIRPHRVVCAATRQGKGRRNHPVLRYVRLHHSRASANRDGQDSAR